MTECLYVFLKRFFHLYTIIYNSSERELGCLKKKSQNRYVWHICKICYLFMAFQWDVHLFLLYTYLPYVHITTIYNSSQKELSCSNKVTKYKYWKYLQYYKYYKYLKYLLFCKWFIILIYFDWKVNNRYYITYRNHNKKKNLEVYI